jgi:secreted PhoX family phosphatase
MDRRKFVKLAAAGAGAGLLGGDFLRPQFTTAEVNAGLEPYGSLGHADANGIELPRGFSSRVIARSGESVGATGHVWHSDPDGGACFPHPRGGWLYVSNAEVGDGGGGVSAVRFDALGVVIDSYPILHGTSRNCAGGPTPWQTWLSCEENGSGGRVWECDPFGPGQGTRRDAMGSFSHEAAAVDRSTGHVYLTEDDPRGRLYRFTPRARGDLSAGELHAARAESGVVRWIRVSPDEPARPADTTEFDGGEGAWVHGRVLYFTTKGDDRVWALDLATGAIGVVYDRASTPDAPLSGVDNITIHQASGDLFVCEDGGNMEICVIATVADGVRQVAPFLHVVGQPDSELTGAAFSPSGTRLYFSSQRGPDGAGITYEVSGPFRSSPSRLRSRRGRVILS